MFEELNGAKLSFRLRMYLRNYAICCESGDILLIAAVLCHSLSVSYSQAGAADPRPGAVAVSVSQRVKRKQSISSLPPSVPPAHYQQCNSVFKGPLLSGAHSELPT